MTYRQGFLDKLVDRFISVWFARETTKQQPEKDGAMQSEKETEKTDDRGVQDLPKEAEPPSHGEEKPNTNKEVPER